MRTLARKRRAGQAMVESAMVLMTVIAVLIGTLDFGQLMFTHQALVERVRGAIRWGIVRAYDGSGNQIANRILYGQSTVPDNNPAGYLGLTRQNVQVTHTAGAPGNPNEERIAVAIVNYQFKMFSPWVARSFSNNYAVSESAPMLYRP